MPAALTGSRLAGGLAPDAEPPPAAPPVGGSNGFGYDDPEGGVAPPLVGPAGGAKGFGYASELEGCGAAAVALPPWEANGLGYAAG